MNIPTNNYSLTSSNITDVFKETFFLHKYFALLRLAFCNSAKLHRRRVRFLWPGITFPYHISFSTKSQYICMMYHYHNVFTLCFYYKDILWKLVEQKQIHVYLHLWKLSTYINKCNNSSILENNDTWAKILFRVKIW